MRSNKGFTLIECLIAISILSIALLATASLTISIIKDNHVARRFSTATTLVQDKVEDLKMLSYLAVASSSEGYNTIAGYSVFRRNTIVTVNSPVAGAKQISVTVFWDNDARKVSADMIMGQ